MLCSFCHKEEPVRIDIKSLDLRICPACKASFLPAEQLPELRRSLEKTTKIHWIRVLSAHDAKNESSENILCMEHGGALERGEIPGFSFESLVPKCCSLQHLTPSVMVKILEMGLGSEQGKKRESKTGFGRLFGGFIFRLWEKRHPTVEDEIDRLQYNCKFKAVLEGSN